MTTQTKNQKPNLVLGRVTGQHNHPLANLIVQVFDRDMRSEELLGENTTDREGKYEITWSHSQLSGRGKKEADIVIKVLTQKKKQLLFESDMDYVRFNASPREEINIIITTAIKPEAIEYDHILKGVRFLANKVAITELQENEQHRDITFLSKELEVSADKIEHLVVAHRLQAESNIDAAFFYALLRKNTLLKNDFRRSFHIRLSVDINTEIMPLLYDAALADSKVVKHDTAAAAEEMIVSPKVAEESDQNIEQLQKYKKKADEYYKNEHPRKVLDIVSRFVLEDKISEMAGLFQENKNDLNSFFKKIADDSFFKSHEAAKDAKASMALAELIGFDEAIVSQVKELQEIKKPEDVRKLAALNKAGWKKLLTESAEKIDLAGKPIDKKLIDLHSSSLVRKMEKKFPTVAFSAQLAREKKKDIILKNHEDINEFFAKHEDFDLQHTNIDLFLKKKRLTDKKNEAMREELKSVQRIFKLVPHYSKTNSLLKQNIHSAQSIAAVGETRFIKEIALKAGINTKEAKEIYRRAEHTNTAAMFIVGELQDTMRAKDIPALKIESLDEKLEAVSKDFPNLKSLFKLTDVCECEHCRSVYSPAAYLVEILEFLDKRSVTDLTVTPHVTSNLAKGVLFERRPDLGEIDLGCENANTPVPYIDLVCELLEEKVAPDIGIDYTGNLSDGPDPLTGKISNDLLIALADLPVIDQAQIYRTEEATTVNAPETPPYKPHYLRDKKAVCRIDHTGGNNYKIFRLRQTLSSAEELAAAPEYVNIEAYKILANEYKDSDPTKRCEFAFKLPFDLDHTEASAYFSRFGISRAKLMEDFQSAGDPVDEAVAAEKLGLTDAERKLIVTPDAANQQKYWNTATANASDEMKIVDTFLTKSGLTYKELELLLSLKFIDLANNLFIEHLDLTCDTEQKEIANLDDVALDRIHRFLRLQKKTEWKFEVLDEIIYQDQLGQSKLDENDDNGNGITNGNECLIKASGLVKLSEEIGIKLDELIGFYGEIPHTVLNDEASTPLYHQIFLNKARNGFVDERLSPEKVNGSQLISALTTSISVCLQITEQDLYKNLLPLLPDGDLITFPNLSYLFAASRLMKKLKLKAEDFNIFIHLTGINIQDSPQTTLNFVEAVRLAQKSPLKTADVQFMLLHQATNLADRKIKDDKITQILEKLQKEYLNNFAANKSSFDENLSADEQKESLQTALSKLQGIGEEEVKTFTTFIDGNWASANDARQFTDDKLAYVDKDENIVREHFDTAPIKSAIDDLKNALPTKEQDISNYEKALLAMKTALDDLSAASTPAEIAAAQAQIAAAEAQIITTLPKYNLATGRDLIEVFLTVLADHQLYCGKLSILEQILTTAFKVDLDVVKIILKYAELKQPAPGTGLISDFLLSDTLIGLDDTHTIPSSPPITDADFTNQYRAIKLLHKLFPLVISFKLANQDLEWFFKNNKELEWFEWDAIPYSDEPGQTAVDYSKYVAFTAMIDLMKQLTPVPNPADAEHPITFLTIVEMLLPANGATRSQFLEAFSLLTGYNKEDVDAIDAHLFPVFDLSNYKDAQTWKAISDCAEHLRKLGSPVSQVKEYIKPKLIPADTSLLRTALKARYDEDTWLTTLKEIMDAIRPQKRDALVAYLLATNPEMKDENYLYDYFLVDVEMEACMPSSRIVQAHGTIQLFVQRCLMGLEPKAAADVNNDKSWEQWKWMKNYRVWEANRKVFLYPENWIEAELRDDKSFLFTELENELLQNELTEFTAEEALIKYLEKLDNIAFLEVMATWYQSDIKTMHVFARTKGGDPAIYYYRKFEQERYWTPWEKVELDITGDHLLAFIRNSRLCLAWPVFSEEPDPYPKSTVPNSTSGTVVDNEKAKRKLKIQLAISEYANNKWQPKKVSKDAVKTPPDPDPYTEDDIPRGNLKLFYNEFAQQVVMLNTIKEQKYVNEFETTFVDKEVLSGAFNITGCKGYPELTKIKPSNLSFIPIFRDTKLIDQRYKEQALDSTNDLSVLNVHSILTDEPFDALLSETPGSFRLTFPHQFTKIDFVAILFEILHWYITLISGKDRRARIRIPLGTLLPYFKEDSIHAYVIIPGFYKEKGENSDDEGYVKRTGSDVMQLIEDIQSLINKLVLYQPDPTEEEVKELLNDFQEIINEVSAYSELTYGEQFKNMYHPLVCPLRSILYKHGIPELMKRETQLQCKNFNFKTHYDPTHIIPKTPYHVYKNNGEIEDTYFYPIEDLDFSTDGSYSSYNWELFFHIPFLLATRLTQNQRFEEAMTWFHYVFNPTGAMEGTIPQKYWMTKPFFLTQDDNYITQRIDTLLKKIADPDTPERKELDFAIDQWRTKPFKPHVVARFRPVAYQKALLMKYIDNLTEWGDYLFRQDTMESIVQATQMYIMADKLLGPKPRTIPPVVKAPYETYNQIKEKLDSLGNALIDLENILPDLSTLPEGGAELPELPPPPITLSMLYFCIPQNDKMLEYWDRIEDRLFKIRHCQNIDGIERTLALFAPPIDPGMLVRAAAAGLDISSVLAGINAPAPYYRFNVLSQKATELAQEVRGLGSSLLQALEKKDAEAMSLLRSELEIKVLNAIKDMKLLQIKEAEEQIEILKKTKAVTEERQTYYSNIEKIISKEQLNLDKLDEAKNWQLSANITYALGAGLALIPDLALGASGFGGSPHGAAKFGGSLLAHSTDAIGKTLSIFSAIASYEANRASILGGFDRRFDDWKLQERLANKEIDSIKKQITAAEIRKKIAETDLNNHELQIENAKKTDEFMRSKFTNKELYDWMIGQISSVYFKAYQLAHDFAKKAEQSYRFELGNNDSFISYGYWDSMKKGLQSADNLIHDIKRMETSYLDKNKREYELTKHVSLAMLNPLALVQLRASGVCDFDIPEPLFDLDHAGHYFRRIKFVSISLPCIAGPYTSVSAKLSLVKNQYRKNINSDNSAGTGYAEDPGNDERFIYNVGAIQSIAASNSQNDSGVFELNFRDERYLPFEGTGAISGWRLELPEEVRQFDYDTISDVIVHMKYTAREGGSNLKNLAVTSLTDRLDAISQELNQTGLHVALYMRHDLPNEWHLFKQNSSINLRIDKSRLPYMAQTVDAVIEKIVFVAKVKNNPANFIVKVDGVPTNLARIDDWKLCKGNNSDIELDTAFDLSVAPAQLNNLEELMMVVKYNF